MRFVVGDGAGLGVVVGGGAGTGTHCVLDVVVQGLDAKWPLAHTVHFSHV